MTMGSLRKLQLLRTEHVEGIREIDEAIAAIQGSADAAPSVVSLPDFIAENDLDEDEGRWLIRTQMPTGGLGFLTADPGLGKTTLAVQISLLLAAGQTVFGYQTMQARTLLIAAEGARSALSGRVRRAAESLKVPTTIPTWYVQGGQVSNYLITSPTFETMLRDAHPALVILDTLKYFWAGDENSADSWQRNVSGPLKELGARYRTTFLCIHHHRKSVPGEESGPHRGRGSGAMFADADFWWRLEREKTEPDGAVMLFCDKNKYGFPFKPMKLTFLFEGAVMVQREG